MLIKFSPTEVFTKIKTLATSQTGRHIALVYFGKIIEAAIGLVSSVLVTRLLGPVNLGILMSVLAFASILSSLMGYGLDITVVKFLADSRKNNHGKERKILQITFIIIGLFVIFFGISAYFSSQMIAITLFNSPELEGVLKIGILVAISTVFFLLLQSTLRGYESFIEMVVSNTVGRSLRLALIIAFIYYEILTIENVLFANIFCAIIIGLISSLYLKRLIRNTQAKSVAESKNVFREIFDYSFWIYGAKILYVVFNNMNVLMLGFFKTPVAVGYYSAALNLLRPFEFFPESLNHVLLPKVSQIKNKKQYNAFIKKVLFAGCILSLPLLPLILFSKPIILLIFGEKYLNSALLVTILSIHMAASIILNPLSLLVHRLNMPKLLTYSGIIALLINFISNVLLIPRYGEIGCAISMVFVLICSKIFILPFIYSGANKFTTVNALINAE